MHHIIKTYTHVHYIWCPLLTYKHIPLIGTYKKKVAAILHWLMTGHFGWSHCQTVLMRPFSPFIWLSYPMEDKMMCKYSGMRLFRMLPLQSTLQSSATFAKFSRYVPRQHFNSLEFVSYSCHFVTAFMLFESSECLGHPILVQNALGVPQTPFLAQ